MTFDSHAAKSFAHLQQCSDELLQMYLHCASELLSKIHHMTDTSQIPAEGLNHYTVLYGLNLNKLKDKVAGHRSTYWRTMGDCFNNIHAVGSRYHIAKGYSQADCHAPEVLINMVKSTKGPGTCFKCNGPHFQSRYMKNKSYPNDKFCDYKKIDNPHNCRQIIITMVSSLQAFYHFSYPNKSNQVIHFTDCQCNKALSWKDRKKYTLQKKSNIPFHVPKSQ